MRYFALAMLISLFACSDQTRLAVHLQFDESWQATSITLAARDKQSEISAGRDAVIDVPDTWAGEPLELHATAFHNETAVGRGSALVIPERGATVPVTIVLSPLACGDWCTEGATQCRDASVVHCTRDGNGCLTWTTPIACPVACAFGICADACASECVTGEQRCAGPGATQTCRDDNNDGCATWSPALACEAGMPCSLGACAPQCASACTLGATRCDGGGVSTCEDRNADRCTEWGPPAPCDAGTCVAGKCQAQCQDECTAATCDGDVYKACGQFDADPCKEYSMGTACVSPDPCITGTCTPTGCKQSALVCNQPDGPACVNDGTLRTYDNQGTCQGGTCTYTAHDRACPSCPSCDACVGVACNTPPSPGACYEPTGTCQGGSCAYAYRNGGCDDGNACTIADTCANGVCRGQTKVCNAPPAPRACYARVGDCREGACSYGYANGASCDDQDACTIDDSCANGARRGTPKPCAPKPAICADTHTLRRYTATGCNLGSCSYSTVEERCPHGCDQAACRAEPPPPSTTRGVPTEVDHSVGNIVAMDDAHFYGLVFDEARNATLQRRAISGGPVERITGIVPNVEYWHVGRNHVAWGTSSAVWAWNKTSGIVATHHETGTMSGLTLWQDQLVFGYYYTDTHNTRQNNTFIAVPRPCQSTSQGYRQPLLC